MDIQERLARVGVMYNDALFIMLLSSADHYTKAVFFIPTDRDACNSNPCANGGTCSNNATGYQCVTKTISSDTRQLQAYIHTDNLLHYLNKLYGEYYYCEGGYTITTICD